MIRPVRKPPKNLDVKKVIILSVITLLVCILVFTIYHVINKEQRNSASEYEIALYGFTQDRELTKLKLYSTLKFKYGVIEPAMLSNLQQSIDNLRNVPIDEDYFTSQLSTAGLVVNSGRIEYPEVLIQYNRDMVNINKKEAPVCLQYLRLFDSVRNQRYTVQCKELLVDY